MATSGRAFGRWHLRGGRYEGRGLPVEMLGEFARYERLVIDVAKGIYKQRHARRQRVPRGFTTGFELRLADVLEGSVIPVLEAPADAMDGTTGRLVDGIFDEARLLIQDALRAVSDGGDIPRNFPPQALREFASFGRTLREDERIVFDEGMSSAATYSQHVRRALQERAKLDRFEVETLVNGQVVGLWPDKSTFEFRLSGGDRTIQGRFSSDEIVPDLHQYLNLSSMAPTVAINAVAIKSADEAIVEIQDVLSVESVLPGKWSERLRYLSELEDGWLDGSGVKIVQRVLRQAELLLLELVDSQVERPGITPTEKGGVELQWTSSDGEVSAEIGPDQQVVVYAFSKTDDDEETDLTASWTQLDEVADFIRRGVSDFVTGVA